MFRTGDGVHIFGLCEDTAYNTTVGKVVKLVRTSGKRALIRYHVRLADGVVISVHPNNVAAIRKEDNSRVEVAVLLAWALVALAAYIYNHNNDYHQNDDDIYNNAYHQEGPS